MINNEVLKRIRYILALNEDQLLAVFAAADSPVSPGQLNSWFAKDGSEDYQRCNDYELGTFLDGLINFKRGKKEGAQPEPDAKINNNAILRKLKIAFDMQNEEVLEVLSLTDSKLSRHELTAMLRNKKHKHYRVCKDEVLINFLTGLKIKHRDLELVKTAGEKE